MKALKLLMISLVVYSAYLVVPFWIGPEDAMAVRMKLCVESYVPGLTSHVEKYWDFYKAVEAHCIASDYKLKRE